MPRPADPLDLLLRALADRTRRDLLDRLRDAPGLTLSELLAGLPQSRQALSKHLALLEDVELVVPVWRGREKHHFLNPAPLQALPARWIGAAAPGDGTAIAALRDALAPPPEHGGHGTTAARPPAAASRRRVAARAAPAPADPIVALLCAPPSPRLQGQPVLHADALAAAIDYLAGTARAVRSLSRAMATDQGYERPRDGAFCLVEHLWHLADVESLGWRRRFERILADGGRPELPSIDGDRLAREVDYRAQPWRGAARRFVAERRRSLAALARFDAEALRRPVRFAGQRARAGGVVAAAVAHDLDHRPAMAALWAALVATRRPQLATTKRRTR